MLMNLRCGNVGEESAVPAQSFRLRRNNGEEESSIPMHSPRLLVALNENNGFYSIDYTNAHEYKMEKLPNITGIQDEELSYMGCGLIALGTKIYMIGGMDRVCNSLKNVIIYDTISRTYSLGPKLNAGKVAPVLLVVGSKIFAFSERIHDEFLDADNLEDSPRLEVLDTSNLHSGWSALPQPKFPPPNDKVWMYKVDAHAASLSGVYISVKGLCSFAFSVNDEQWKISNNELPFSGEAIFVNGLFFALPRIRQFGSFCVYKLEEDTGDADIFYFDLISIYNLPSSRPYDWCSSKWCLAPSSINTLCVISACYDMDSYHGCHCCFSYYNFPHFITVEVYDLSQGGVHDERRTHGHNLVVYKPHGKMTLSWCKRYQDELPFPEKWVLV